MNNLVAITGASGFIGKALSSYLISKGIRIREITRNKVVPRSNIQLNNEYFATVGDIDNLTEWGNALEGVNCIVHCAARAHITKDSSPNPLKLYRSINVEGTIRLAEQAAQLGVKRFIFLSTIGVHGISTTNRNAFSHDDTPNPIEDYAKSKLEAEIKLWEVSKNTGLEVVILRVPLVYGPGVKANFLSLIKLVHKRVPLPLGSIKNLKSFISIDNLVYLIECCIGHPNAPGNTFLASDCSDISTANLVRAIATQIHEIDAKYSPPYLPPCPDWLLFAAAKIIRKERLAAKLLGSLQIDASFTQKILGWTPIVSMELTLKKTIEFYLKNEGKTTSSN